MNRLYVLKQLWQFINGENQKMCVCVFSVYFILSIFPSINKQIVNTIIKDRPEKICSWDVDFLLPPWHHSSSDLFTSKVCVCLCVWAVSFVASAVIILNGICMIPEMDVK